MAIEVPSVETLVAPISDEQPTGRAMREKGSGFESDFYKLRDDANEARTAERKLATYVPPSPGEEDPYKPLPPDWNKVLVQTIDVLLHKSKDLWVVAWLIEAQCRLNGYSGLRDGFRLARQLCEKYWGQLYPGGSEGNVDNLMAQFAGLNGVEGEGTLIQPIRAIPITGPRSGVSYSFADFIAASELDKVSNPERRAQRIADGEISMEQYQRAVEASTREYYGELLDLIDAVIEEFNQLVKTLDQHCRSAESGKSLAPPSSNISEVLSEIRHQVCVFAGKDKASQNDESQTVDSQTDVPSELAGPQVADGQIASREDAFRRILSIAEFFERTEPHSPVSFHLRQAVRWGRLSLPELLTQLIDQGDTRNQLFRQIGIEKPAD